MNPYYDDPRQMYPSFVPDGLQLPPHHPPQFYQQHQNFGFPPTGFPPTFFPPPPQSPVQHQSSYDPFLPPADPSSSMNKKQTSQARDNADPPPTSRALADWVILALQQTLKYSTHYPSLELPPPPVGADRLLDAYVSYSGQLMQLKTNEEHSAWNEIKKDTSLKWKAFKEAWEMVKLWEQAEVFERDAKDQQRLAREEKTRMAREKLETLQKELKGGKAQKVNQGDERNPAVVEKAAPVELGSLAGTKRNRSVSLGLDEAEKAEGLAVVKRPKTSPRSLASSARAIFGPLYPESLVSYLKLPFLLPSSAASFARRFFSSTPSLAAFSIPTKALPSMPDTPGSPLAVDHLTTSTSPLVIMESSAPKSLEDQADKPTDVVPVASSDPSSTDRIDAAHRSFLPPITASTPLAIAPDSVASPTPILHVLPVKPSAPASFSPSLASPITSTRLLRPPASFSIPSSSVTIVPSASSTTMPALSAPAAARNAEKPIPSQPIKSIPTQPRSMLGSTQSGSRKSGATLAPTLVQASPPSIALTPSHSPAFSRPSSRLSRSVTTPQTSPLLPPKVVPLSKAPVDAAPVSLPSSSAKSLENDCRSISATRDFPTRQPSRKPSPIDLESRGRQAYRPPLIVDTYRPDYSRSVSPPPHRLAARSPPRLRSPPRGRAPVPHLRPRSPSPFQARQHLPPPQIWSPPLRRRSPPLRSGETDCYTPRYSRFPSPPPHPQSYRSRSRSPPPHLRNGPPPGHRPRRDDSPPRTRRPLSSRDLPLRRQGTPPTPPLPLHPLPLTADPQTSGRDPLPQPENGYDEARMVTMMWGAERSVFAERGGERREPFKDGLPAGDAPLDSLAPSRHARLASPVNEPRRSLLDRLGAKPVSSGHARRQPSPRSDNIRRNGSSSLHARIGAAGTGSDLAKPGQPVRGRGWQGGGRKGAKVLNGSAASETRSASPR